MNVNVRVVVLVLRSMFWLSLIKIRVIAFTGVNLKTAEKETLLLLLQMML